MPKAKTRKTEKNSSGRGGATRTRAGSSTLPRPRSTTAVAPAQRPQMSQAVRQQELKRNRQNLFTAALVSLGCWGFALTFVLFTDDPNRYLFGGMAAIMALMWSGLFGIRLRKLKDLRQERTA